MGAEACSLTKQLESQKEQSHLLSTKLDETKGIVKEQQLQINEKQRTLLEYQAEIDRLAGDDQRFQAFMKRRMEDSTGSGSDKCDDMCKRFQLCNMSFGNLAEFLQCVYRGYSVMAQSSKARLLAAAASSASDGGESLEQEAQGATYDVDHGKNPVRLASDMYN